MDIVGIVILQRGGIWWVVARSKKANEEWEIDRSDVSSGTLTVGETTAVVTTAVGVVRL